MKPICPICNQLATPRQTQWGVKHVCCGLWSWGNKPLTDAATHKARQTAHDIFDRLWKSGTISRGYAYQLLQEELGISKADCHMSIMDQATATRVPDAVYKIRERLGKCHTTQAGVGQQRKFCASKNTSAGGAGPTGF